MKNRMLGKTGAVCVLGMLITSLGVYAAATDLPVPAGYSGDPETLTDAFRQETPTRVEISLNGLWRVRPIVENESVERVPEGDWGWGKVPSFLPRGESLGGEDDMPIIPAKRFEGKNLPKDANQRLWYRRTFTMPSEAAGHRVLLSFAHLHTRADIFLDGKKVATVCWPGGEADITDYVKPGQSQTLALYVISEDPDAVEEQEVFMGVGLNSKRKAPRILSSRGITGDVTLALVPQTTRIDFSWGELVEADSGAQVRFVAETKNLAAGTPCTLAVKVEPIAGCKGVAREFRSEALTSDAEGTVAFSVAWADVERWDEDTPNNRYRVAISLLDEKGNLLDAAAPFETGFRTVRVVGKDVLLNGRPLHMRPLLHYASVDPVSALDYEASLVFCRRARAMGFNSTAQNCAFIPDSAPNNDEFMRAADETGFLYANAAMPTLGAAPFDRHTFFKDLKQQDIWRKRARQALRSVRRHPSAVFHKLNMNMTGYGEDHNPRVIAKCAGPVEENDTRRSALVTAQLANEVDPTRPAYNHDSGLLGDFFTSNIYLGWAPPQERADWVEGWSKTGTKPVYFVEYGTPDVARWSSFRAPYFIYATPAYQSSWVAEYSAAYLGEKAYTDDAAAIRTLQHEEKVNLQTEPPRFPGGDITSQKSPIEIMGLFWADTLKGFRGYGLFGALPWCQTLMLERTNQPRRVENPLRWKDLKKPGLVPDFRRAYAYYGGPVLADSIYEKAPFRLTPFGEAQRRWGKPCIGFIGGDESFTDKRHHYIEGEVAEKRLVLINDRSILVTANWSWKLTDKKGVVRQSAKGKTTLAPGARVDESIRLELPKEVGYFKLRTSINFEGERGTQKDSLLLETFAAQLKPLEGGKVSLYDPVGLTAKLLTRLNIPFDSISAEEIFRRPWIIIGRETLTRKLWDEAIVPAASDGRKILIFEQTQQALEDIGFRVQNYGLRQAYPRFNDKRYALFNLSHLRDWAGASTLVLPDFDNEPRERLGRLTQNWAGFRNSRVWRANNRGCIATVIPEKPHVGDWRALVDGMFGLEYSPLLEGRFNRGAVTFCQLDVTARTVTDPFADELVRTLVTGFRNVPQTKGVPDFLGRQAIITGRDYGVMCWATGKDLVVSSGAKKPDDLFEQIKAGAKVLALGLTAKEIAAWSPVPLAVAETNNCYFSRIEKPDAELLNGLSNADFYWHGGMSFAAFQGKDPTGNAALKVVRYGKGAIVFWQLPPWVYNVDENPHQRVTRRAAYRMLGRLMGNMDWNIFLNGTGYHKRIMYRDSPIAEDDPYRWVGL